MGRKPLTIRSLVLALLFSASSILVAQQPGPSGVQQAGIPAEMIMAKGRMDGQMAAQNVGTGGWLAGGVASTFVLPPIGTGIIWVAAGRKDVSVPADRRLQLVNEAPTYQQAFKVGYRETLKSKRKGAVLGGYVIGSGAFLLLFIAAGGI